MHVSFVRVGEDPRRRLAQQVGDGVLDVDPREEPLGARLDEAAHERAVLVERRPAVRAVLLEREREVGAVLELAREDGEGAEAEAAERVVEVRRAHPRLLRRRRASLLPGQPRTISAVPKPFIGVRWWLGVAFAVVAATSTAIVVSQFSDRSENAFRLTARSSRCRRATGRRQNVTPATLERFAGKQQGLRLELFAPTRCAGDGLGARARGREAALAAAATSSRGRADGGIFVAAIPYHGQVLVAVSRQPDTAEAIDTVNGEALRAGVIAGVIGVIVGLLLRPADRAAAAPADARRPRRSRTATSRRRSATASATSSALLAHSFDRMRRQLRRSFRRLEAERDRLRLLLERLHEGVLTIDQDLVVHFANTEARRILGGRLREGDELPEPWQGFGLREFAHAPVRRARVASRRCT